MDLSSPKFFQPQRLFSSNPEGTQPPPLETNSSFYGRNQGNPFVDTFTGPLCQLNLKETSDFIQSLPIAKAPINSNAETRGGFSAQRKKEGLMSSVTQKRVLMDAPSTTSRPGFSFNSGNINLSRKSFPSKWDDAEKWVMGGHDSPAHNFRKQCDSFSKPQMEVFAEKTRVTDDKFSKFVPPFHGGPVSLDHHQHSAARAFNGVSAPMDVFLKDKLTDVVQQVLPPYKSSEPSKEGFLFRNTTCGSMKEVVTEVIHEVKHRDMGTEMTPIGSSTNSRCHTPFMSLSPARHNTPANRSGPLGMSDEADDSNMDLAKLSENHLAKLQLGTQFDSIASNWSSREEEEEDVSKSLRHFETGNDCQKSVSDSKAVVAWEDEEKTKSCLRYQREEARIQAWVNLQSAKAEAQSRKLEVKIQKMRSALEEKLMKRMAVVHRKADELRTAAGKQHMEQMHKETEYAKKIVIQRHSGFDVSGRISCSCFPCNNYH